MWPEAVDAIGSPPVDRRWIAVADREADDFQMFHACRAAGQGLVIRAQHGRYVQENVRLREMIEQQPAAGGLRVDVSRRGRVGEEAAPRRRRSVQKARRAKLLVRYVSVMLQPPRNDRRYGEAFTVQVVQVKEIATYVEGIQLMQAAPPRATG